MENINKKPQKKKFSFFCCFCTNDERRKKRKEKHNSQSISSPGIKTNLSELNSNIKVKDLSIEENLNKLKIEKKQNEEEIKKSSSFINEEIKSNKKIKIQKNLNEFNDSKNNIKNNNLKKENNIKKFNTISNIVHNKSFVYNSNNLKNNLTYNNYKNISLNENIYLKRNKYIYNNFDNKNDNSNKEEMNSEKSNENLYQNNVIYLKNKINKNLDNNFIASLSSYDKIEQKYNLNNQENDDNVNLYDENNTTFNDINKFSHINSTEKEIFMINNELKLTKNPNLIFKHKKNDFNGNNKNKTDSIIYIDNDNNDFGTYLNMDKKYKNTAISIPYNNYKLNLSSLRKKENNPTTIYTKRTNDNKINIIKASDIETSFPYIPNRFKYSHSLKLNEKNKTQGSDTNKEFNYITGRYTISKNEKNSIKINFKNKKGKNIFNEENIKIDKEKTIVLNYQSKTIINKIKPQNIASLPFTNIENELHYINVNDYFGDNSQKDITNNDIDKNQIDKIKKLITNSPSKEQKKDINNNSLINLEEKEKIIEAEENINDFEGEIEDDQDDSEENKHINDSKSIISNFIVTPLIEIKDKSSYAPSLYSKSELKDNISNLDDLISNRVGGFSNRTRFNDTEFEIMNENESEIKPFIEHPRTSRAYNIKFIHKDINFNKDNNINNINYNTFNKSLNQKMKIVCDKIKNNSFEIQKLNEEIMKIDYKIKDCEKYNKKYELLIEKEEEESDVLIKMINFLNNTKK